MTQHVEMKLTLPRIPDVELVAIEGLDRLARHLGIAEGPIGEARIAVTEAIINAFEHAGVDKPVVRVEFTITPKELVVFVRDYGKGFTPEGVEDPEIEAKIGSQRKRGWGLKLIKSLSDGFQIESGKRGTKITITKRLS